MPVLESQLGARLLASSLKTMEKSHLVLQTYMDSELPIDVLLLPQKSQYQEYQDKKCQPIVGMLDRPPFVKTNAKCSFDTSCFSGIITEYNIKGGTQHYTSYR